MSFAITMLTFRFFGITVNSMTLGGLAVAIGMVVDDAIVDVENVFRRLRENASLPNPLPRLEVIAEASAEVRSSIFYATVLIVLVFVPLLGLTGVEGKLVRPDCHCRRSSAWWRRSSSRSRSFRCSARSCCNPKAGREHSDGWLVRGLKAVLESHGAAPWA